MSGSPKYSTPSISPEVARRLRQERERRAAEERARRAAEEARRRAERLARARGQASEAAATAGRDLEALAALPSSRFVAQAVGALRDRVRLTEQTLARAADEAQVQAVRRQLRATGDDIRRARADAEAAEVAERAAEETARARAAIEAVRRQAAALDAGLSARFDPDGLPEVAGALAAAEGQLAGRRIDGARRHAQAAAERLEAHRRTVAERFEAWTRQKEQAEAEVAVVEDRLAGLLVDEVFGRWCAGEGDVLRRRSTDLAEAVRGGRFAAVARESAAILEEADRLAARAQELQLKHERHRYVVRGIIEAMRQEGFVIQSDAPAFQQAGGQEGAPVLIHAERLDGGALAVTVPPEGAVAYEVDGYPLDVEAARDGREVAVCDEAEARIQAVHAVIEQAFGVRMGELTLDGKDPDRIARTATDLPDQTAEGRHQAS